MARCVRGSNLITFRYNFHTYHRDSNGTGRISEHQFAGRLGPNISRIGDGHRTGQTVTGIRCEIKSRGKAVDDCSSIAADCRHIT